MIKRAKIVTAVLIIVALTGSILQAGIIEINLTAKVTGLNDLDDLLEGSIDVNDTITGSYTYDSEAIDSAPSNPSAGNYWHYTPEYGISLSAGGFVFQTDPDNVEFLVGIYNDSYGSDGYLLRSYNNLLLSNGVEVDHISWQLNDYTCTALSSDALLLIPPVLEDWEDQYLRISFGYKGYSTIGVEVTSVELVPEPGTILLLGLGGVWLLRRRRR